MGMGLRTSGWLFRSFYFLLSQKIIQRYMHKRVNVIGLTAKLEMQQVCPTTDDVPMWTKQHLAFKKKKKKSILFVLPDILMFIMRVLYYHDDYNYSCAILVYCCLNVTLFFYDMMRWKPWAWEWWPSFKKSETIWSYLYTEWMLQVAS